MIDESIHRTVAGGGVGVAGSGPAGIRGSPGRVAAAAGSAAVRRLLAGGNPTPLGRTAQRRGHSRSLGRREATGTGEGGWLACSSIRKRVYDHPPCPTRLGRL